MPQPRVLAPWSLGTHGDFLLVGCLQSILCKIIDSPVTNFIFLAYAGTACRVLFCRRGWVSKCVSIWAACFINVTLSASRWPQILKYGRETVLWRSAIKQTVTKDKYWFMNFSSSYWKHVICSQNHYHHKWQHSKPLLGSSCFYFERQ